MSSDKPIYLYVTPFFPSEKSWAGGFCLDAVRAIRRDGRYEVVVMTATDYGGDYEFDGFKVCQFPRKRFRSMEYFETLFAKRNNRYFLEKLAAVGVRPEEVAVCHVHDFEHYVQYALALKKLNPNCLTLVHHHYAGYYRINIGKLGVVPLWSDLLYLKIRREFEAVDAHVFISEHCKSKYGRRVDFDTGIDTGPLQNQLPWGRIYRSIQLQRSYVLYNGVDTNVFKVKSRGEGEQRTDSSFVIGCAANFNPCKRQIDLIRAIEIVRKAMPQVRLKLLGTGRTRATCEAYVREHELGDVVQFVEPVPHDKLADFYRSLDLFVMPSVNEGFCCVNVEAHACGVPFMAVKGLPMDEVLPKESHDFWLFTANDSQDIAAHILVQVRRPQVLRLAIDLDVNRLAVRFLDWLERMRG